ncbi:hypothetical protein cyc_05928 [Cyclospora cayetanensis]|uniref:Uncharacterized protein n=1 Tax=Cyclospora cayetanensis TaxID=88456 RepID=A0A1D3D6J9_9EIME|nr:hypothetical protein cyc_05928 [Cyclospora cayetanensis]
MLRESSPTPSLGCPHTDSASPCQDTHPDPVIIGMICVIVDTRSCFFLAVPGMIASTDCLCGSTRTFRYFIRVIPKITSCCALQHTSDNPDVVTHVQI